MKRFILLVCLTLCNCGLLATPAVDQYRLDFAIPARISGPALPIQLVVDAPEAMQALDTEKIAIYEAGGEQRYYEHVRWTDRAPVLLQDALIRSLESTGTLQGASRREAGVRADYALQTTLQDFEDEPAASGRQAHISFTANLIAMSDRRIVASHVFDAVAPVGQPHFDGVIDAFDQALAVTMQQAVGWVDETLAAQPPAHTTK